MVQTPPPPILPTPATPSKPRDRSNYRRPVKECSGGLLSIDKRQSSWQVDDAGNFSRHRQF